MSKRFVNPALSGPLCLVLLTLLILRLSATAYAQVEPQGSSVPAPKRIVLLYSYGDGIPAYQQATRAFLSVMKEGRISVNNLFFEYLDLERKKDIEHYKNLVTLLRHKYAKEKIDLIVTVHTPALRFLLNEGRNLFPKTPALSYLAPDIIETAGIERQFLLLPMGMDFGGTLELAQRLFPQTMRVVFVNGIGEGEKRLEREAKSVFAQWRDKLEFEYTSDLSVEEMLQRIATLPPRTIVIYSNVFTDKTGRTFVAKDVAERVAKAANAPVFGMYNTILGIGIIGGSVFSFEAEGTRAGTLALDILRGKLSLTKPVTILTASRIPMFDWQQLKRWGVSEIELPKESIFVNRSPSFWDKYKRYVIGVVLFLLAQSILIVVLLVQIRRRELVEKSLRQKKEELDQFFNVSLDLLCIANTDGYFLRLNPAWERILGYTREELVARRFFDFLHPDDLNRTREVVSTLASQQKVFSFENRYCCKDGTYRWLEWTSAPAGNLIYAAARDVTERKQMEEKLQEAAEEWQANFDSIQDLVMILDQEFKIVRVNASTLSFFQLPLERIVGNHCYTLMHGTNEPLEICPLTKMMKTKRHEETELYDEKRDAWFQVSVDPIFNDKGETINIVHVVKDITGRKRMEAEAFHTRRELLRLERLSRMGELTASLSHELNQPLTAILSNARAALRFIQSDRLDVEELKEILQDIANDDKRAGDIIRSLRSMVKPEEAEREPVSINDVLRETVSLFNSEAIIRSIRVEMDFTDPLPLVHVNEVQIRQVIINLMMNAAESVTSEASENRKIVLQSRAADHDAVQVAVRDFGPGIEEKELNKIFEPFFTTKRSGLGMGLSLSRSIIEAHGGHIWVENNPDQGVTFYFDLPTYKRGEGQVKSVEH